MVDAQTTWLNKAGEKFCPCFVQGLEMATKGEFDPTTDAECQRILKAVNPHDPFSTKRHRCALVVMELHPQLIESAAEKGLL